MSRFHFDESAASTVSASLNEIRQNVGDSISLINSVWLDLYDYDGFNIGYAIESLKDEKSNMTKCTEKIQSGVECIVIVTETVKRYSDCSYSLKYLEGAELSDDFGDEFKPYGISKYNSRYQNFGSYIAGVFNGFSYIEEGVAGFLDGKGFKGEIEYNNTKESLELILKNMCEGEYKYDPGVDEEIMKNVLKVLKGGGSLEEILHSDLYDDTIKKYLKGLGELVDVKELSEEIVVEWYSDYSEAMTYIDALGYYGIDSDIVPDVINELKDEYSNKYWHTFSTIVDKAKEEAGGKCVEVIVSAAGTGATAVYSIEKFAFEMASKLTGSDKISDAFDTLNGLVVLEDNSMRAYNTVVNKIESGSFTDVDVDNYRKLFEINRALKISEYESLLTIDKSDEYRAKYLQAISELKAMKCPI